MDIVVQFKVFMIEAYRELNSKKMFWLVIIGSLLVAALFGSIGIGEDYFSFFGHEFKNSILNTQNVPKDVFFKQMLFFELGVDKWLTVFAMLLAIISTGSLMPDFLSSGTIDMMISKPLSRWRLFILKYLSGLVFVFLQVSVFTVACFFVIGFRVGSWEWGIFLVIPLVVLFFSYVYSISVWLAVHKCSSLTCILVTIILWGILGAINTTDSVAVGIKSAVSVELKYREIYKAGLEDEIKVLKAEASVDQNEVSSKEEELKSQKEQLSDLGETVVKMENFIRYIYYFKTVLPKTEETTNLIKRVLIENTDVPEKDDQSPLEMLKKLDEQGNENQFNQQLVKAEQEKNERKRSVFWVLGTSLIFEVLVLFWAGFKFSRKDF